MTNTKKIEHRARLKALQLGRSSLDLMLMPEQRKRKLGLNWNHGIRKCLKD